MNEARLASFMKKLPKDIIDEYSAATAQAAAEKQAAAAAAGKGSALGSGSGSNNRGWRPWVTAAAVLATVAVFFAAGVLISMKLRAGKQKASVSATDDLTSQSTTPTATPDATTPAEDALLTLEYIRSIEPYKCFSWSETYSEQAGGFLSADGVPLDFAAFLTEAPLVDGIDPARPEKLRFVAGTGATIRRIRTYTTGGEFIYEFFNQDGSDFVSVAENELLTRGITDNAAVIPDECFVVIEVSKTGTYYPDFDRSECFGWNCIFRFRYAGGNSSTTANPPTPTPEFTPTPTIAPDATSTPAPTAAPTSIAVPTTTAVPTATSRPTSTPTARPTATAAPTATATPGIDLGRLAVTPRWDKLLTVQQNPVDVDIPYFMYANAIYIPELDSNHMFYSDGAPLDYNALFDSVPVIDFTGQHISLHSSQPNIMQSLDFLDRDGNVLLSMYHDSENTFPSSVPTYGFSAEIGTPADSLVRAKIYLRGDYVDALGQYEYTIYYGFFRLRHVDPVNGTAETRITSLRTTRTFSSLSEPNTVEPGTIMYLGYIATPNTYTYGTVRWKILEGSEYAVLDPVSGKLTAVKDGTVRVAAYVEEYDTELVPVDIVIQSRSVVPEPEHEVPLDAQYRPDIISFDEGLTDDELNIRAPFLVYNGRTPDELPVYTYKKADYYVSPYENDFTFYVQLTDYGRAYSGNAELHQEGIKVNFYDASGNLIGYSYTNRDGIAMFTIKKQDTMSFRVAVESSRFTSSFTTNYGETVNRPFYPGGGLEYAKAKKRSGEAALFPVHVVESGFNAYDLNVVNKQSGNVLTSGTVRFYGSGKLLDSHDLSKGGGSIYEYAEFWSTAEHAELDYIDGNQRFTADCTLTRNGNTVTISADIAGRTAADTQDTVLPAYMVQGVSIKLGHFEQDGDFGRYEPIEWLIVKTEGNKALVVSRYVLYALPYNVNITVGAFSWSKSTLRTWLNSSFLDHAFNDEERAVIQTASAGGVDGKLILLSGDEVREFQSSLRKASATPFAESCGSINTSWWIMGGYTSSDGSVSITSSAVQNEKRGVRPAMWIELTPEILETAHYVY